MSSEKAGVDIVYTHFPHYRGGVFSELSSSEEFCFNIYYDSQGVDGTIKSGQPNDNHVQLTTKKIGPFFFQPGAVLQALRTKASAAIYLGNVFVITTWIALLICRLRGIQTFLWTHGWLESEPSIKGFLRRSFYRMSNGLLLYGNRAKLIGVEHGFSASKMHVIYNSMDYSKQKKVREMCMESPLSKPYFCIVGRLVSELRLDLAIEAAAILRGGFSDEFEIVVIGDGPLRQELESAAANVQVRFRFLGAIYEEDVLGAYIANSVAVLSPGKVGLLAMHALAYGRPVVTHSNFDLQMPEVEALVEGVSAAFFSEGSASDLADVMYRFLSNEAGLYDRNECINMIEEKYNPQKQAKIIEAVLKGKLKPALSHA